MKRWISLLLAAVLLLALTACGKDSGATDPAQTGTKGDSDTLYVASSADMTTMDVAQTTNDYFVPNNIFDRLFEVQVQSDGTSQIVNSLCESYTVSPDGLTYSIKLVEGV